MATNISHWLKVQSRWFKITYLWKSVFDQLWIFEYCFHYSFTLYYCAIFYSLDAGFFSKPSRCQTVWIQIRPDILSNSLNPDQAWHLVGPDLGSNCLQRLLADKAGKELIITKQLVDTFGLKPWLKLISFGSNFFHWLKCWLQQILSQGNPCKSWCWQKLIDFQFGFSKLCQKYIQALHISAANSNWIS